MAETDGTRSSNPELAQQFDDMKQQFESAKLGMGYFLSAEIMLFSALFCLYAVYRTTYPEVFAYGSRMLDVTLGGLGTAVLLLSSLAVALAVRAVELNRRRSTALLLALTLLLAGAFLWVKYREYIDNSHANRLWGYHFYEVPEEVMEQAQRELQAEGNQLASTHAKPEGGDEPLSDEPLSADAASASETPQWLGPFAGTPPAGLALEIRGEGQRSAALHHIADPNLPENSHVFYGIHFCMTRVHALHVFVGMLVMAWLLLRVAQGKFSSRYYTPLVLFGQYWHFLVIVWLFLFPLLYLVDP